MSSGTAMFQHIRYIISQTDQKMVLRLGSGGFLPSFNLLCNACMAYVGAGVLALPRAAGGAGAAQGCAVLAIVAAASVRVWF